jgi:nucleoside-diphosphate-sugar epimerase
MLDGKRILITGPTGQVALPVARALAERNQVIGIARFSNEADRARLVDAGVECVPVNLAAGTFDGVPADVDYVLHFAVVKTGKWDLDMKANAEATGLLMAHCRRAAAFLHCSSTGVYEPAGTALLTEASPLGDNHRVIMPTYSIAKISTEAVVRTMARHLELPTTIARLNVPYGDEGGWPAFHLEMILADQPIPVHPDRPNLFNPIHADDIVRTIEPLLGAASVPATIFNWGGSEQVALEDWVAYLGEVVGRSAGVVETESTIGGVTVDVALLEELAGPSTVGWKDGFRRMVIALHPELVGG